MDYWHTRQCLQTKSKYLTCMDIKQKVSYMYGYQTESVLHVCILNRKCLTCMDIKQKVSYMYGY